MRASKALSLLIIIINVIGVICLFYYAIPCLIHDTMIVYPDAMLPSESWCRAGMILTFGFIPLFVANVLNFLFARIKHEIKPYLICGQIMI